jgi:hypothetical protein
MAERRIHQLFKQSIAERILPRQWLHAKIIPLKKPGKSDYTVAKIWRPISLLATLGKALEALVAERISYLVEELWELRNECNENVFSTDDDESEDSLSEFSMTIVILSKLR